MTSRFATALLIGVLLFSPRSLAAQQTAGELQSDDLVTDRPDVAASGLVVGRGRFQIEAGVDIARAEAEVVLASPIKARFGLSERLEGHFETGTAQWSEGAGAAIADVDLGAKAALWENEKGTAVGLLVAQSIPLSEIGSLFKPTLIAEGPLSDWLGLGINLGYSAAVTERTTTEDFARWALSFGWALPDWRRLALFNELFGELDGDGASVFANAGGTYKITPAWQIDAYARTALVREREIGGGFGLSYRAP